MRILGGIIGLLPKAHGALRRAGITETAWFRRIYPMLYFAYKRTLEDPFAGLVRRHPDLFASGDVLDVGANIGYTSLVFARALAPGLRVFAFEPERRNFDSMLENVRRNRAGERIVPVNAAVGERSGRVLLRLNEEHRGDHRISTSALPVTATLNRSEEVDIVALDAFAEERGIARVSFVKIDVQGYETSVCRGMDRLLRDSPGAAVAVEYAPDLLEALGFRPAELLEFFAERGFVAHRLARSGRLTRISEGEVDAAGGPKGYLDLLFARRPLQD